MDFSELLNGYNLTSSFVQNNGSPISSILESRFLQISYLDYVNQIEAIMSLVFVVFVSLFLFVLLAAFLKVVLGTILIRFSKW